MVRVVAGSFFFGVGALVLYTFLSGGGPTPMGTGLQLIVGWLILTVITLALGVLPLSCGFTTLFVTGSYCIHSSDRIIESRTVVCGVTIWVLRYPFHIFDRITNRHYRSGFPVSRDRFLVSAEGSSRRIRISTSADIAVATQLASRIATELGVPVETAELNDDTRID